MNGRRKSRNQMVDEEPPGDRVSPVTRVARRVGPKRQFQEQPLAPPSAAYWPRQQGA